MKRDKTITKIVNKRSQLLDFLYEQFSEYSNKKIKSFLTHGNILVNNIVTTKYNRILIPGDEVKLILGKVMFVHKKQALPILYEDNEFVVINKPAGLLSVATEKEKKKTAYRMIKEHVQATQSKENIYVVHRLDQETSGVLLFTKNEKLKKLLQDNWNDLVKLRKYLVIVEGNFTKDKGVIKTYLKENKNKMAYSTKNKKEGKLAITNYHVIKKNKHNTLLEVFLETGRKNQIRIHMKELGFPVIGDKKYKSKTNPINRLGLHASALEFIHPITKKTYYFEAPTPIEFEKIMKI